MENVNQEEFLNDHNKNRPSLFKVMCVLSFISIGFSLLTTLLGFLSGPSSVESLKESAELIINLMQKAGASEDSLQMLDKVFEQQQVINSKFYLANGLTFLFSAIGFLGVYWMWNFKKNGFHAYIIYCLFSMAHLYIVVPIGLIITEQIVYQSILSLICVLIYSRFLKLMN